jgi:hypothetical protein
MKEAAGAASYVMSKDPARRWNLEITAAVWHSPAGAAFSAPRNVPSDTSYSAHIGGAVIVDE